MTSLHSSRGLGVAQQLAPGLLGLCLKLLAAGTGLCVQECLYRPGTVGDGMSKVE